MCGGRNKLRISLALVATILFSSVTLAAQDLKGSTTGDWSRLNTVTSGSKLSVKLKNGKTVEGRLTSVSEASLSLSVKDKSVELKRPDILSVYQTSKKSATKATLIGMGVGAGAGAGIGLAATAADNNNDFNISKIDHVATAALTIIGAGAGALTGYLIGRSGRKKVLIYQA